MPALDDPPVRLRGGPHSGRIATVDPAVTRLYTPSEAPGLLDVYEESDAETDGEDIRSVFDFVGQVPVDPGVPEHQHPITWDR
ncbi:MAG: hypothetical protein ABI912_00230 [Actinomycetota bacterium]